MAQALKLLFSLKILLEHMHELFITDSPFLLEIFLCLLRCDRDIDIEGYQQPLIAIILSTLMSRRNLARVCHDWSELLSKTQTLSVASLHLNIFGCDGFVTEIITRCAILRKFHFAAYNPEDDLCRSTIVKFFTLPWRLRVARLKTIFHRSDILSRYIFGEELKSLQNFFSSQTIALVERAIAEYSAGIRSPTRWTPGSQQHSQADYMQYELLNFRPGNVHDTAPDEFLAYFKDVKIHPWQNLYPMHGSCWTTRAVMQLSSVLYLPPQIEHEVHCKCIFNFRNQSFEAVMRVFLNWRLDLTLDFVNIPSSSLDV